MSYTPFQAPFNAGLVGDDETAALFSIRADLECMLSFEVALAEAQAEVGLIERAAAEAIAEALPGYRPDMDALRAGGARDGVVVPELVKALRALLKEHAGGESAPALHYGTTSQDVVDTAAMMHLRDAVALHAERLDVLIDRLDEIGEAHGDREITARTRMQRALPIRLADKLANWGHLIESVAATRPERFPVQLGGPDGTLHLMGDDGLEIAFGVAERLGLTLRAHHWQVDRAPIVEIAQWFARVGGALGKIGADVALMAQNEVAEVRVTGAGGSSAMAHKQNPVRAEVLVTLAHFTATLAGGMGHAMVHENERSGAMWTLEWMLMPQLAVACGASTRVAGELLGSLAFD